MLSLVMSTVIKSQPCLSYLPFEDSSHSHSDLNFRLRMITLLARFTLKVACRIVTPLAEKIVRPFLSWMSMRLTPDVSSVGCSSGDEADRSAPVRADAGTS